MNKLTYKEYETKIEVSFVDNCLYGKIEYITDLVTFESDSIEGIKKEFKKAVDNYLKDCKSLNKEPEKPYTAEKRKINWGLLTYMRNAEDILDAIETKRTEKDYIFVISDKTYEELKRILIKNAVSLRHYSRTNAVVYATHEMQCFFKIREYIPYGEVWIFPKKYVD